MAVYYKKLIIGLWDYKITTVHADTKDHSLCGKWPLPLLHKVAAIFGAEMSYQTDLNFRTQTVPRCFYWLQQRDININQVTFKQIITIVKGFSNSYPW